MAEYSAINLGFVSTKTDAQVKHRRLCPLALCSLKRLIFCLIYNPADIQINKMTFVGVMFVRDIPCPIKIIIIYLYIYQQVHCDTLNARVQSLEFFSNSSLSEKSPKKLGVWTSGRFLEHGT